MSGRYMSLICVKERARTTFKIIGSVLKTKSFPARATGLKWIQLHCKLHHIIHRVKRCLVSKSKTTYSVIVLIQGYSTTLSGNEISSAEFFENWLDASCNSSLKGRIPYLITKARHRRRKLLPSYRQTLRSSSCKNRATEAKRCKKTFETCLVSQAGSKWSSNVTHLIIYSIKSATPPPLGDWLLLHSIHCDVINLNLECFFLW